jgi:hypothetical protein
MSETKINVGKEVAALLQKLGLEPGFVKEFHLTPTKATVTVFKRDAGGSKYLEPSPPLLPPGGDDVDSTGFSQRPATETVTYEVRT